MDASNTPPREGHLATILLLDDDTRFRRALVPELQARGLRVLETQHAREADVLLAAGGIDLVVVDGLLPDESGIEWIARHRAAKFTTPLVFCSAFFRDLPTFKRLTAELGVLEVRHKPIEAESFADELLALIPRSARSSARRRRRSSADAILFLGDEDEADTVCPAVPTVLVADEDPALVGYLASLAHDHLLNLVGATEIDDALAAFERHAPIAALVGLPFGEPDAASALVERLRVRDPQIPVGAFTLDGDFASRRAAAAVGAYRMLHHPLEPDAFVKITWELETSRCAAPSRVVVMPTADPDGVLGAELERRGAEVQRVVDFDALFEVVRPDAVVVAGGLYDAEVCSMVRASAHCGDAALILVEARDPDEAVLAGADRCLLGGSIARRAELTLAHAQRVCRRRRVAHVDYLTGLPRRPAIARSLRARLAAAHREGRGFSLAVLDIVGLAQINARHGRLAGDRAITTVGRLLSSRLRGEDLLGRWAGDRLLVGFSTADASLPAKVLDRLAAELGERPLRIKGGTVPLGFHRGLAHYPHSGDSLRELLGHAHRDLLQRRGTAATR